MYAAHVRSQYWDSLRYYTLDAKPGPQGRQHYVFQANRDIKQRLSQLREEIRILEDLQNELKEISNPSKS